MMRRKTKHYSAEQWADFVRGQLSDNQNHTMQDHLDAGCKTCSKSLEFWQEIQAIAKRESLYEVPEWVLRYVRNAFSVTAKPRGEAKAAFRIPRLVLDSFWQPAVAGVRSAAGVPRHLRYRSDEIAVELQLEPELRSERVMMVGQVSNMALGGKGVGEVRIFLSGANGEIARASTNKLGEFLFSFVPEKGLQVALDLANGEQIAIPLSEGLS
jgi:hypothetical protein